MKNYWFITCSFFLSGIANGQVADNFSDGNFTADPTWSGSTSAFIVNASHQLQLSNSTAGTSYLSTPMNVGMLGNFEWRFLVSQSFSSSANNFGRVYLVSNQADLTQALNGYYLQFGEAGSNDAIGLFRQTGSESVSICKGTQSGIASSFAVGVDVVRNSSGQWRLSVDYTGKTNYVLDATGIDSTFQASAFFGVLCVYTVSNDGKFFYDDFYGGPQLDDTAPPKCQSTSAHSIALTFSEALNAADAESTLNYAADHSIGNPQTASLQQDQSTVLLTFNQDFPNGPQNSLTVSGIRDLAGNIMDISNLEFTFLRAVPALPKDIILTEIFADPSPSIGLPDAEYVEIYNRSANPFDLSGWTFGDDVSVSIFPSQIILPQQYWIVTAASDSSKFTSFGNVLGLSGFPTLNNGGDDLILKSPSGVTIDSVNYAVSWYEDASKENGGWSLELIDLNNPCGEDGNWIASQDPKGGSPGKPNSVNASKPDVTGPRLLSVVPIQANQLLLTFDEKLDKGSPSEGSFALVPFAEISKTYFADKALRKIQLDLSANLQGSQRYSLTVRNIRDCNGNLIQEEFSQLDFALPEPADSLDILINEILFNPRPGGVDFVEVYNHSVKYINLNDWKLAHFENGILGELEPIATSDYIVSPNSYLVFTSDPGALKNNYPQGQERNFLQTGMPSLPDDEGTVAVVNEVGEIIDHFSYSKSLHSKLLKDDEGVSLERISFSGPTNDRQNWESASSQAGFATPGFVNSSARPDHPAAKGTITIEPEIFAPYTFQDFAKINYEFDQPGYIANIEILDPQGHLIKTITNNATLGYEGFFRWEGDRDDGTKARIGYYLVWVEVFDLSGRIRNFRKRVVLATR